VTATLRIDGDVAYFKTNDPSTHVKNGATASSFNVDANTAWSGSSHSSWSSDAVNESTSPASESSDPKPPVAASDSTSRLDTNAQRSHVAVTLSFDMLGGAFAFVFFPVSDSLVRHVTAV